ncbi:MAG: hypothetical protein K1X67_10115 [Fimbriimonadaceae bacterium]|nr:hypothetical protein [Fimbriimonadaceae bacterium]
MKLYCLIALLSLSGAALSNTLVQDWRSDFGPPSASTNQPFQLIGLPDGTTFHLGRGSIAGLTYPSITKVSPLGLPLASYLYADTPGQFNAALTDGHGNVYVCGSIGTGSSRAILVKLDQATMRPADSWRDDGAGDGVRLYSNGSSNTAQSIAFAPNGDLVAGISTSLDCCFLRLDPNGDRSNAWADFGDGVGERRFDFGTSEAVRSVRLDEEGNCYGGLVVDQDMVALKLDSEGSRSDAWPDDGFGQGLRKYGMTPGQNEVTQGIIVTPERSVIVFGSSNVAPGNSYGTILKLARDGSRLWTFHFDGPAATDHLNGATLLSDGSVVAASSSGRILKVDGSSGALSPSWQDTGDGLGVRRLPGTSSGVGVACDPYDTIYAIGSTTTSCAFLAVTEQGHTAISDLISLGTSPACNGVFIDAQNRIYLSGNYFDGTRKAVALRYSRYRLSGSVHLQDWAAATEGVPVTIEMRNTVTGVVMETHTVNLDENGRFRIDTAFLGPCVLSCQTLHWLRDTSIEPSIPADGLSVNFDLVNGDCDGDNEVGIGDYAQLSAAYGSSVGDANFDPMADLNGDEAVDIADYAILSSNYGMAGDD